MTEKTSAENLENIRKFLQYHKSLGINEYPRTPAIERFLTETKQTGLSSPRSDNLKSPQEKKLPPQQQEKHFFDPGLSQKATLQDVRDELGNCKRCHLHETRTNIVFGQGPVSAKLMIVADAPGTDDDRQSEPFQGSAGELLDKMLAAINLSRDEVYLTELVKCYPGAQAKPREAEIKTCLPFLFRQIEIICPAVICTMGMLAAQTILHSRKSLFQLRGRFFNFNDLCSTTLEDTIVVMPTLHPAILLENSDLKKASWRDLQMIQKKLKQE